MQEAQACPTRYRGALANDASGVANIRLRVGISGQRGTDELIAFYSFAGEVGSLMFVFGSHRSSPIELSCRYRICRGTAAPAVGDKFGLYINQR
jgi:hypothetical protein